MFRNPCHVHTVCGACTPTGQTVYHVSVWFERWLLSFPATLVLAVGASSGPQHREQNTRGLSRVRPWQVSNNVNFEIVLIRARQWQARVWVGVWPWELTLGILTRQEASRPKVCSTVTEEGGMCALSKAARAGNKSGVMGESGGVSEGVVGLSLQCTRLHCQVNATPALFLCSKFLCPTAIKVCFY